MIVVSNTSPLNYLVLIEAIGVVPQLYDRIYVPAQVMAELKSDDAPAVVRAWSGSYVPWRTVREMPEFESPPDLHPGEAAAISLAIQMKADLILIDERRARQFAAANGLSVSGTLGVIRDATQFGLIDGRQVIARLQATNFRASNALIESFLKSL